MESTGAPARRRAESAISAATTVAMQAAAEYPGACLDRPQSGLVDPAEVPHPDAHGPSRVAAPAGVFAIAEPELARVLDAAEEDLDELGCLDAGGIASPTLKMYPVGPYIAQVAVPVLIHISYATGHVELLLKRPTLHEE